MTIQKTLIPLVACVALCALMLFIVGMPVHAQQANDLKYVPLEPLKSGGVQLPESGDPKQFGGLINGLFKLLLGLSALLAVGTLVWGGIVYMISEVMDKRELARRRIQSAIWGLLLLLCAYIILNTINPQLVNFQGLGLGQTNTNTPAQTTSANNTSGITNDYSCTTQELAVYSVQENCTSVFGPAACIKTSDGNYCGPKIIR